MRGTETMFRNKMLGGWVTRNLAEESDKILRIFNQQMNPIEYIDTTLAEFMQKEYSLLVIPMGIVRKMIFTDVGRNSVKIHSEKVE